VFREWVYEIVEVEQQAELTLGVLEWFLSQFEDDPMSLSEIQVPGSVDDLPEEYTEIKSPTLSDDQVTRLQNCFTYTLRFFLIDEPFQSQRYREQVEKTLEIYGISPGVISEFRGVVMSLIRQSDLDDEFVNSMDDLQESISEDLEESLTSSLDVYEMRDRMMRQATEMLSNFHIEAFVESGLVEEILLEGGTVLEEAENPAFPMFWYGIGLSYVQECEVELAAYEEIEERYREQLAKRQEYESELEDPIVDMQDSNGIVELEKTEETEPQSVID